MNERDLLRVRADIGTLFQESALFDSLTVAENVGYRLYEETDMPAVVKACAHAATTRIRAARARRGARVEGSGG
jgi:ABC-type transporter Mla maintaining outer membrane lipid asymmetry ATPase subunit MlaF